MYQLRTIVAVATALLVCAGAAVAGGPPVVNETTHFVDAASSDVGLNCATGNTSSERTITSSGVLRLLVFADGSYGLHGLFRGDVVFDDIPAGETEGDGTADAASHFRFQLAETVPPSGNAIFSEIFSGTTTALATDTEYRLHVTYKVVVDPAGVPRVDVLRITCE